MIRVYVTGATGVVGRNLIDVLQKEEMDITVLHRESSDLGRLEGCRVGFQEVDLHDIQSVRESMPLDVDALFHVAANTSHWSAEEEEQWRDNVLATRNLVQVALEKKVGRFIFTSTGATRFFQETDQSRAERIEVPYVRTKRLSELEVYAGIEKGLDAVILHPIIVVGAYDHNNYSQIFHGIKSGKRIAFPGKIAFCHAGDVAEAHLAAFKRGRRGERYVLGGPHISWADFFRRIAITMGEQRPIYQPPAVFWRFLAGLYSGLSFFTGKTPLVTKELLRLVKDEPDITIYDRLKTKEDLGYESRSVDEMVRDCHAWLVQEGRL